jgi:hypothetical protein
MSDTQNLESLQSGTPRNIVSLPAVQTPMEFWEFLSGHCEFHLAAFVWQRLS